MHPNARRNDLTALTKLLHPLERELCPQFVDRVSWARSRAWSMIKFVVKPTNRGWAIYQEGAFVGECPTRRAAMNALAEKRQKLKASGAAQLDQIRTQRLSGRPRRHHRLHRFRLPHLLIDVAGTCQCRLWGNALD